MTSNTGTVLRVVCLICVVGLVFGNDNNASNERVLKEKRRKAAIQQTVSPLLFPASVCSGTGNNNDIEGVCSYLTAANVDGCCTGRNTVPQDVPRIEPSTACSPECLSELYSFWCYIPCTSNVSPAPVLCQADIDSLFAKCNGCSAFGTYDNIADYTSDFTRTENGVTTTRATFAATGCVSFLGSTLITEDAAPVVETNTPVVPGDINLVGTTPSVAEVATIRVTQPEVNGVSVPPLFMDVGFTPPNSGNPAVVTNTVTKRSEDFTQVGTSNVYETTHQITIGKKALTGTWAVTVSNVNNMFGTQSNVQVSTFDIESDFTVDPVAGAWGTVNLCSGASQDNTGSHVLQLRGSQSVSSLSCCAASGCEIRCDGTTSSTTNVITALSSTNTAQPLTFRDCSIDGRGGVWQFPALTTIIASNLRFVNTGTFGDLGVGLASGSTCAVTTPDNSRINVSNGASLRQQNDGTIVSLAANTEFDRESNLILSNDNQHFRVEGTAIMKSKGVINLSANNQRFILNPAASDARNQLFIDGEGIIGDGRARILSAQNSNLVQILAGRLEVTRQGRIECNVQIGPQTTAGKVTILAHPKFQVATSTPNSFVAEICCASLCSRDMQINPLAALFVIPPEGSEEESCVFAAPTSTSEGEAARIQGNLVMRQRSRIVMTGAKENGHHLFVEGTVTIEAGTLFEVELAPSNTNTNQHEITLMSWTGGNAACNTIEVVVTNKDPTRPPTQYCDTQNTRNRLRVTIPKAKAVVNPTNTAPSFSSADTYSITFNKELVDCPETCFTDIIARVTNVDAQSLNVLSYVEKNDITATFRCLSTQSVQHADGICAALVEDARTSGNSLNEQLNVVTTTVVDANDEDDDGNSNTALYGLFGLIAIIPLLILAVVLFMRNKKRKADNQYMQDTATFSNVAASPQPINYPYPYGANGGPGDVPPVLDVAKPPPAYVA